VFAFHVNGFVSFFIPASTPIYLSFVHAGHTGVDLFFVLSAFLLSRPFLDDGLGGRRVRLRDYFVRRALRILPLYWTAVLVGTALSASRRADLLRGVPHILFLSWIPPLAAPIAPYGAVWWSLETEIQFYLLLPLLAVFLRTSASRRAGLVILALYGAAYVTAVRCFSSGSRRRLYIAASGRRSGKGSGPSPRSATEVPMRSSRERCSRWASSSSGRSRSARGVSPA
jgi:peptidoglycan/LPS O-acetylase OafA/YrhL